jgi:hypothetical protein
VAARTAEQQRKAKRGPVTPRRRAILPQCCTGRQAARASGARVSQLGLRAELLLGARAVEVLLEQPEPWPAVACHGLPGLPLALGRCCVLADDRGLRERRAALGVGLGVGSASRVAAPTMEGEEGPANGRREAGEWQDQLLMRAGTGDR